MLALEGDMGGGVRTGEEGAERKRTPTCSLPQKMDALFLGTLNAQGQSCAVLGCLVLCCAVLCCVVLSRAVLCWACLALCCIVSCCIVLCCAVLCCAVFVLRCAVLCCAVLCRVVLCCAVSCVISCEAFACRIPYLVSFMEPTAHIRKIP